MRDRKGWKALGYESFGEYGKQSLGYEKAYLTQLADAGEISLQLGYDPEFAIANKIPPESQLRPLKSVPEDVRKQIWDEATKKAEADGDKRTAKHVEMAVAELPPPCGFQITQPETKNPDRHMADRGFYLRLAQTRMLRYGWLTKCCVA